MTPRPGTPVRGSTTGRPIMALFDLVGRRWALRLLWELHQDAPVSFRRLQERCDGVSSSVLNQRLSELREARLVRAGADGYDLTDEGRGLVATLEPVSAWAARWARSFETNP